MRRHVFCCEFTTDDRLSQDRVGRSYARGDGETCQELEVRDHGPYEESCNEPSPLKDSTMVRRCKNRIQKTAYRHDRSQEERQRLPMMLDIFLRKYQYGSSAGQITRLHTFGNSTPIANTPTAITTLVTSNVISSVTSLL